MLQPYVLPWRAIGILAVAFSTSCAADDAKPLPEFYVEPDVADDPVSAAWSISVDTGHDALETTSLAPSSAPATIEGAPEGVGLEVQVKDIPNRPDLVWVELFFENRGATGIMQASVTIDALDGANAFYDLQADPHGGPASDTTLPLGGLVRNGVESLLIGLPKTNEVVSFELTLDGVASNRESTRATPIAVSPDGKQVWSAIPDADQIAVIDTDDASLVDSIDVEGHPSSVAFSTDGRFVAVAAPRVNEVHIYDVDTRERLRVFREKDGIGRAPRYLAFAPDGSRIAVSSHVGDTVTVIGRHGDRFVVEGDVAVGRRPESISIAPDGRHAFVSHMLPRGLVIDNAAWISVVDLHDLELVREAEFLDVFNLDTAHCLADVFGVSASRMTAEGVRTAVAGAFLSPSGTTVWAPGAALAAAPILERGPAPTATSENFNPRPGEWAPAVYMLFDAREPDATRARINAGGLERPADYDYISCANVESEIEMNVPDAVPGREHLTTPRFAAFPTGITGLYASGPSRFVTFSPGGRVALGLSYVSDHLVAFDPNTFQTLSKAPLELSGSQPIGMAFSPDGRHAYVSYENSMHVSVLDTSAYASPGTLPAVDYMNYEYRDVPELMGLGGNLITTEFLLRDTATLADLPPVAETVTIDLGEDPLDPDLRRGKVLFASANPKKHPSASPVAMTSCYNCHPDGGSDGSVWVTMEGERRTMSLRGGVSGRGWLHIAGTHRDIHEFIDIVATERLGANLSPEDLDAFARYVGDGIPPIQPPKVDMKLARKGEALFQDKCTGCHQGELRTSGTPDPANKWGGGAKGGPMLFDVGTAVDDARAGLPTFFEALLPEIDAEIIRLCRGDRDLGPGDRLQEILDFRQRPERKRGEFKAPALVGLWDQPVYFHDARFDDLNDVVDFFDGELGLGLADDEKTALVEYLKTL